MLDFHATAGQLAGLAHTFAQWERDLPAHRARALAELARMATAPLPAVDAAAQRWVALPDGEPLDARVPAPAAPPQMSVVAVDGSQIEPDFHEGPGCLLINVGWAMFRFEDGASGRATLGSRPAVEAVGDTTEPGAEDDVEAPTSPHARSTEVRRMRAEVDRLRELVEEAPAPCVALADGPLVAYWVLNLLEEPERSQAVAAYQALFETARDRDLALAGYISRTRSAEVTHLLRYGACAEVEAVGLLCAACRAHFPRVGRGPAACYAPMEGVADRHLFRELLARGERSACFRAGGRGPHELEAAGHALRFFYLRAGDDLARVEVPAWVAADRARLDMLHATLLEQAALGRGYPLALAEAHEQAVVRGPDRAAFFRLLRQACGREEFAMEWSPKLRAKRQPVG